MTDRKMGCQRTDNCGEEDDDCTHEWQRQSSDPFMKGVNMIRITDKSFRYTPSFNTDLRKKFRKIEQERRAAEASNRISDAAIGNSVVPMVARRSVQKV
jgi:hypothetical protein